MTGKRFLHPTVRTVEADFHRLRNIGVSASVAIALVVLLITYEAMFSASIGLAMWLINSEIFPTALRGKAGSCGMYTHWGLNLIISLTVLSAFEAFTPSGLFWLYAAFGLVGLCSLKKYLPETRNGTLEEVEAVLRSRVRKWTSGTCAPSPEVRRWSSPTGRPGRRPNSARPCWVTTSAPRKRPPSTCCTRDTPESR